MSCPHATTTTLLWLYGEADEAHADHVAGCPECRAVAADQADVASAMVGITHLDLRDVTPRPQRRWISGVGVAVALAAAAALFLRPVEVVESDIELAALAALDDEALDDPLDEQFEALALELGDLADNVRGGAL